MKGFSIAVSCLVATFLGPTATVCFMVPTALPPFARTSSTTHTIVALVSSFVPFIKTREPKELLAMSNKANDDQTDDQPQKAPSEAELIMEQAAMDGASDIRQLSIEERTKRAMLAETVEDRIFEMYDELEVLVEKDGTVQVPNREQVEIVAKQLKASQDQYTALVGGKRSSVLDVDSTTNDTNAPNKNGDGEDDSDSSDE